jgi:hypothetical protein
MKIETETNSPLAKAQLAARTEIVGPSKGRSARHVYLAELLKGAIEQMQGHDVTVAIGYDRGMYHCRVTNFMIGQRPAEFSQPTLSDLIMSVNESLFCKPEHRRLQVDYTAACEDVDRIRKEWSSGAGAGGETRSQGGIIIPR